MKVKSYGYQNSVCLSPCILNPMKGILYLNINGGAEGSCSDEDLTQII